MANPNAPYGAQPVYQGDGSAWNGKVNRYYIPSTDNSEWRVGDWAKKLADADAAGVPGVAKAAAAQAVVGCVVSIEPVSPSAALDGSLTQLGAMSIPSTKTRAYYVYVCDDPNVIFSMRGDVTATNQVAANAQKNTEITVTNPSPDRPFSSSVINSGSIAVTQALVFKLCGLFQKPGNDFGASAEWLIRVNQHQLANNTAGI